MCNKYKVILLREKQFKDLSSDSIRDKAFIISQNYEKIFKKKFIQDQFGLSSKKGIIRITYKNRSLYRRFYGGNSRNIKDEQIGLSLESIYNLFGNDSFNKQQVDIKPVKSLIGKFLFWWNHPVDATRVAFKAALYYTILSLVLGSIISLIITYFTKNLF
jgi:hypothetical protein